MGGSSRPAGGLAALVILAVLAPACRSAAPSFAVSELEAARTELSRPLRGDPAALYRLRVASSGGLRMSLLTSGAAGRLTVTEPFGAAVSITAWEGTRPPVFFDLREGCRLEAVDLSRVLGIGAMPLPQAVRLLVGRLPAAGMDRVSIEGSRLLIEGAGWSAWLEVAPDPWRVTRVREAVRGDRGWRIELDDHMRAVPGSVRLRRDDGRSAELDLVSLEWNDGPDLPAVPELPRCEGSNRD